jgi:hypothetical protein
MSGSTSGLLDGEYIRVFVDDLLKWNTIEFFVTASFRGNNVTLSGPVDLKIRLDNNPQYDYASITALKAQDTAGAEARQLKKVKVLDGDILRIYHSETGTDAESSPDVIRPDDFHSTTNRFLWVLDDSFDVPDEDYLMAGVLIDNVILEVGSDFTPDFSGIRQGALGYFNELSLESFDVDSNVIVSQEYTEKIKNDFFRETTHSDYTVTEIEGVDPENYLRLTKSWLRLLDNTPTVAWSRTYNPESESLIDILMAMYGGQITSPSYRLTGNFFTDIYPSFFNCFYENHLAKYFNPMYLSVHDANNTIDGELIELKTGPTGDDLPDSAYEFTEEFSTEFDA